MLKPLLKYPDPRLNQISKPVENIDKSVRALVQDMIDTLTTVGGVGIAAPQIGVFQRVILVDVSLQLDDPDAPQDFACIINPVLTILDPELNEENEGCLSVPDYRSEVSRPRKVVIDGYDLNANEVRYEGEGYFSTCLQHENDHLDGKLFIEKISYLKRSMYEKKMKKK